MRKLKKVLIVLAVLILIFAGVVAMQPDDYRVERSAKMSATPAAVFEQVNDFHKWEAWSPWIKLDPNSKTSFEGPTSGKDAKFKWSGNSDVGEGMMTITDSKPNDLVQIRLDFEKPFKDTSTAEFTFKPEADQTNVTWSMAGKHNFFSKAICLFMSMDKMIGSKFEEGLASMKKVVEAPPKK